MYAVALRPGSWPPSPGLEPWAILISSWSARARYVGGHAEAGRRDLLDPGVVALAVAVRARTRPGPRRPRRCWPRRRRAGCRSSAPGAPRGRARRRSSPTRRTGARSRGRPRPSASGTGVGARRTRSSSRGTDGAAARSGEGGAIAGQGGVEAGRGRSASSPSTGQDLDLAGDLRREQVGLAVGAEAGEPGVREARLAAGGVGGDGAAAASRRRSWRVGEVGQRRPAGPRRAPSGSSARRPSASRSTTSTSAPPMYDATALMPIRARVLRRPASNAASEVRDRVVGGQRPRRRASRPARPRARSRAAGGRPSRRPRGPSPSRGRRGCRRRRRAMSVRPRRPASVSAVWTAPAARIDGIGSRSIDEAGDR